MNLKDVMSDLCSYDERNPDWFDGKGEKPDDCYCDNCFYGRTTLAEYILKLLGGR